MRRMRCPTCDVDMIDSDRLGVKTGYCPECDGEWFARGAVDRLLDRAVGRQPLAPTGGDDHVIAGPPAPAAVAAAADRREGTWNWF